MPVSDTGTYRFYGWKTADIKDEKGLTPRDYYDLLKDIWTAETCAPRLRGDWSPDNRTLGQCSITAFTVQALLGGRVYGIPLKEGGVHCYNEIDGMVFDLASEQFGDQVLNYEGNREQFREEQLADDEKRGRYELLKLRLENYRSYKYRDAH